MRYFIIISIIVLFDQLSKIWIKTNLAYRESIEILGNFLKFTYVENPGIAFGISVGKFSLVILFLSIGIIAFIIKEIIASTDNFSSISLSMILGGAIGNMIDRICVHIPSLNYGGVIDFIDIGNLSYRWYTFNIADTAVTIGVILYLLHSLLIIKPEIIEKNE